MRGREWKLCERERESEEENEERALDASVG
jgi:hypothetical protein